MGIWCWRRVPNRCGKFVLILATCCVGAFGGMAVAANELVMQDGSIERIEKLPFFSQRKKLLGYIIGAGSTYSIASTPRGCPDHWRISWAGNNSALPQCTMAIARMMQDYSVMDRDRCKCQVIAENGRAGVPKKFFLDPLLYITTRNYLKDKKGNSATFRGVMGFEFDKMVKQRGIVLDAKGQSMCQGSIKPAFGEAGFFDLRCYGGKAHAKGILRIVVGLFTKRHTLAYGSIDIGELLDSGEIFSIVPNLFDEKINRADLTDREIDFFSISYLTDKEINEMYPGFPDVFPRETPFDDMRRSQEIGQ